MDKIKKQIEIAPMFRAGEVSPRSFNEETNTVEMIFTTGARVKRGGIFTEPFFEDLEVSEKAVNLKRLNAGAPFLNSHNAHDLSDIIGVVEKAEIRGKKGIATVRLSNEPADAPIVNKIKSGIIRNVSVGFTIEKFVEQESTKDGTRVFRAEKWTPHEISAVGIPADAGAQFRGKSLENSICEIEEINTRGQDMENLNTENEIVENIVDKPTEKPENVDSEKRDLENTETPVQLEKRELENEETIIMIDEQKIRDEATKAEKTRQAEIKTATRAASLDNEFAEKLINEDVKIDEARKQIIARLAEKSNEVKTVNTNITIVRDEKDTLKRGMENAIMHRFKPSVYKIDECGQNYRHMSLLDHAREMLEHEGVRTRGMAKMELAKRALHSSSDFPILLENIAVKTLRRAFDEAPATWMPFVTPGTLPDFKEASRTQLGDAAEFLELGENAEYQQGTISEAGEKISLRTYGRKISLSRKMLINDDLSVFTKIPEKFGRRARQLESDLIWALLLDNDLLSDGVALFDAGHANLGTGSALDPANLASLGELRQLMRKQKGLDGERMNLRPRWLVVPPELETKANQIATSVNPNKADEVNDFGPQGNTSLQVIVEDRLSDTDFNAGASATAYYGMASVADVDMIELARLEGESGPVIETMENPDIDGIMIKARHDIGVKVLEFRGFTKNAGV